MNKRQAKKQYKRIHGYNPPSERKLSAARRKVYEEYHITPEQLAAALSPEQLAAAAETAKQIVAAAAARTLAEFSKTVSERFTTIAESIESEEKEQ